MEVYLAEQFMNEQREESYDGRNLQGESGVTDNGAMNTSESTSGNRTTGK
jgi:hypothetical protein